MSTNNRYSQIDKLKVLCSLMIICIHAKFYGLFGDYFSSLARFAVPVFFMISGFFFNVKSSPKQIIKLFRLMVLSNAIYLAFKCLRLSGGERFIFISKLITLDNIVEFVLVNYNKLQSHLWYLGAILYTSVCFFFLYKVCSDQKRMKRILNAIVPILLLSDLILGKYSLFIFNREFSTPFIRNWLFVGIPYYYIGIWIRDNYLTLSRIVTRTVLLCSLLLSSIGVVAVKYILITNNLNATRDHYLLTTIQAVSIFLYFLFYVNKNKNFISSIGERYTTWIYILHPMIMTVNEDVINRIKSIDFSFYQFLRPFIVFIITLSFVMIVSNIRTLFSRKT